MQPNKFGSVDEFLRWLPGNELELVEALREIILNCIPHVTEKLSYNVPYYYRHSRICFIWPASVPWGKVRPGGVMLGFCQGHLLRDDDQWLERGNRKQVYVKTYHNVDEIEVDLIRSFLFEAVDIDHETKPS